MFVAGTFEACLRSRLPDVEVLIEVETLLDVEALLKLEISPDLETLLFRLELLREANDNDDEGGGVGVTST